MKRNIDIIYLLRRIWDASKHKRGYGWKGELEDAKAE